MAIYSSINIFDWEISWTEEPGGLQSMWSQKSQTWLSTSIKGIRKWGLCLGGWVLRRKGECIWGCNQQAHWLWLLPNGVSSHLNEKSSEKPVVRHNLQINYQFSSVQLLSHIRLFATPWTAAYQASLSITNSQSLLKLTSIKSVMPSNHLILCCRLLLLPSIFPSIRVFSKESILCIRWPKY